MACLAQIVRDERGRELNAVDFMPGEIVVLERHVEQNGYERIKEVYYNVIICEGENYFKSSGFN